MQYSNRIIINKKVLILSDNKAYAWRGLDRQAQKTKKTSAAFSVKNQRPAGLYSIMERAKGIEPSYEAWEASILPLNYARVFCYEIYTRQIIFSQG